MSTVDMPIRYTSSRRTQLSGTTNLEPLLFLAPHLVPPPTPPQLPPRLAFAAFHLFIWLLSLLFFFQVHLFE